MAERHDNTCPASGGSISISRLGTFSYFPIEPGEGLKPFYALLIHEGLDGTLKVSIDQRFVGKIGDMDE